MICPRCNQTCKDDEIYCHCCGNKLKDIEDENTNTSVENEPKNKSENNVSQNVDDTTSSKDIKFPWLLSVIVIVLIIALICVIVLW